MAGALCSREMSAGHIVFLLIRQELWNSLFHYVSYNSHVWFPKVGDLNYMPAGDMHSKSRFYIGGELQP